MHPGASKGECPKAKLGEDTQRELPGGVRNELIAYAGCGSRGPCLESIPDGPARHGAAHKAKPDGFGDAGAQHCPINSPLAAEGGGASVVVAVWRVAELFAGAAHGAFALLMLNAAGRDA